MKTGRIIGWVFLCMLLYVTAFGRQEDKAKEPVQFGYLIIDGVEHEIRVGEEARIVIAGNEHALKLRLATFRVFEKAGLSFQYPAAMYYAFDDSDPEVLVWSMDGDSVVIIVQEYAEAVEVMDLVKSLAGEYVLMKAKVDVSDVTLKVKNELLSGKKILAKMGESTLQQEVYMFPVGAGRVALVLQDFPDDEGTNSAEFQKMRALIAETFSIRR